MPALRPFPDRPRLSSTAAAVVAAVLLPAFLTGCGSEDGAPPPMSRDQLAAYEAGAARGEAEAEYMLGVVHQQGLGPRADAAKAVEWFRRAADHGHGRARTTLGALYQSGEGVPKDLAEAARWYRLAAEGGQADAQFNLGNLLRDGSGVARDPVEALKWFLLASRGNPRVKEADIAGDELARTLSADEVARARTRAAEFGRAGTGTGQAAKP